MEKLKQNWRTKMQLSCIDQCCLDVRAANDMSSLIRAGNFSYTQAKFIQAFESYCPEPGYFQARLIAPETDSWVSTSLAIDMCRNDGYSCAGVEHILYLAKNFPSWQTKYGIVGLEDHTMWEIPSYPFLGMKEGKRALLLKSASSDWLPGVRFLAVKKVF